MGITASGVNHKKAKAVREKMQALLEELEKEALAQIKEITETNAHLVSNLYANLGGLYRMNGQTERAKEHMEKGILLLGTV